MLERRYSRLSKRAFVSSKEFKAWYVRFLAHPNLEKKG